MSTQAELLQRIHDEFDRLDKVQSAEPGGVNQFSLALMEVAANRYSLYKEICEDKTMKSYVEWSHRSEIIKVIENGAKTPDVKNGELRFNMIPLCAYIGREHHAMQLPGVLPGYPQPTSFWQSVPKIVRSWMGR
jgi:hypothetical protein